MSIGLGAGPAEKVEKPNFCLYNIEQHFETSGLFSITRQLLIEWFSLNNRAEGAENTPDMH